MHIQARKIKFVREFLDLQIEGLISHLEKLLHYKDKNFNSASKRMTIDELNHKIDKSMSDAKKGKLTRSNDLISEINEWK